MRGCIRRRGANYTWYAWRTDPLTGAPKQVSRGGFRTRKECQAALNNVLAELRDAVRWGHVTRNAAAAADPPKAATPEMQAWSPTQLRRFLTHVRGNRLFAVWIRQRPRCCAPTGSGSGPSARRRAAAGRSPGWCSRGRTDHRCTPSVSHAGSGGTRGTRGCRVSACTTCATATRRQHWPPGSRRRW